MRSLVLHATTMAFASCQRMKPWKNSAASIPIVWRRNLPCFFGSTCSRSKTPYLHLQQNRKQTQQHRHVCCSRTTQTRATTGTARRSWPGLTHRVLFAGSRIIARTRLWTIDSNTTTIISTITAPPFYSLYNHHQLRPFATSYKKRKRKRMHAKNAATWATIKEATRTLSKPERAAYYSEFNAARRQVAVLDFPTRLRKLLHKATRGNDSSRQDSLEDFVRRVYPNLTDEERTTMVIPILAMQHQQAAYRDFFSRILLLDGGLPWTLQLRADVLTVLRDHQQQQHQTVVVPPSPSPGDGGDNNPPRSYFHGRGAKKMMQSLQLFAKHIRYRITEHFMFLSKQDQTVTARNKASQVPHQTSIHPLLNCQLLSTTNLPWSAKMKMEASFSDWGGWSPPPSRRQCTLLQTLLGPTKRAFGWYFSNQLPLPSTAHSTTEKQEQPLVPESSAATNGLDTAVAATLVDLPPNDTNDVLKQRQSLFTKPPLDIEPKLGLILLVSFQPCIPSTLAEIHDEKPADQALPVAVFYSIVHCFSKFRALGIGELITHQAIRQIQQQEEKDMPLPTEFVTLSPLYDLKPWLFRAENAAVVKEQILNETTNEGARILARFWSCTTSTQIYDRLRPLLTLNYEGYKKAIEEKPVLESAIEKVLLRASAYYVVEAKTPQRKPLDNIARFHIHNGASVHRINLYADISSDGWKNSCGVMINYRYDMAKIALRQEQSLRFPVSKSILKWLSPPPPQQKNDRKSPSRFGRRVPPLGGSKRLARSPSFGSGNRRRESGNKIVLSRLK